MIELGKMNTMLGLRQTSVGIFLGNTDGDEVLLPMKYIPSTFNVGETIDVFIYLDSEDRPIATTLTPYLKRDEFGYLLVKEQTSIGAFLEWGLEKDLLLPYREQSNHIESGNKVLVYVYLDETSNRLAASARVRKFVKKDLTELEEGMVVDLLVTFITDLGYNVIINNQYEGLLYANEVFQPLLPGDEHQGFITKLREDGKIDVRLQASGLEAMEDSSLKLLQVLKKEGGFIPCGDKSNPQVIYEKFNMSKKNFKRAAGILYKQGLVKILPQSIQLIEPKAP